MAASSARTFGGGLLRPDADRPSMAVTGKLERYLADGTRNHEFVCDVIRVWQLSVETILAGGLGTLPLAPISQVEEPALPEVIRRMEDRIEAEAAREEAGELWEATYILMGLRFSQAFIGGSDPAALCVDPIPGFPPPWRS